MKKTIVTIMLLALIFTGCVNDTKEYCCNISSYSEINELVIQAIEADTVRPITDKKDIYYSLSSSYGFFEIENISEFIDLSDEDLKMMKLQDSIFTWAALHPGIFHEYRLVNDSTKKVFCRTYSVPLLTIDKKYLFIEIGYNVGFLSGRGYLVIFEKTDDTWIEIHRFLHWIS